jgi:hypothetical protein
MNWIETTKELPKFIDGKDYSENVLVWNNNKLCVMNYCKVKHNDYELLYYWANAYGNIDGDAEYDDDYAPTYWMPLPVAPIKENTINYKEKYTIAKTTLEAVLFYIVPDDCRTMVYNALDELNEKKLK